jgi:hypothetical protein
MRPADPVRSHRSPATGGALALAVVVALVLAIGIALGSEETAPPVVLVDPPRTLALPRGAAATVVVAAEPWVLVGARSRPDGPGRPAGPLLFRVADPGGVPTPVPVAPTTAYGRVGTWTDLGVTASGHLGGIARAPGGAHGNARWTTWEGDVTGLRERAQAMETFGGWHQGSLVAYLAREGRDLVVGSWEGPSGAFDVTVWSRRTQGTWARQPARPGSPLASTRESVLSVHDATRWRDRVVAVGSVTSLRAGGVTTLAVAWERDPHGGAGRVDLRPVTSGQARRVACGDDRCLVVGAIGGRLALWTLEPGTRKAPVAVGGVPAVVLAPGTTLPRPAVRRDGTFVVATALGGVAHLLTVDGSSVRTHGVYPLDGDVASVAVRGDDLYVVTEVPAGPATLGVLSLPPG